MIQADGVTRKVIYIRPELQGAKYTEILGKRIEVKEQPEQRLLGGNELDISRI